jgi:hypothetical protein
MFTKPPLLQRQPMKNNLFAAIAFLLACCIFSSCKLTSPTFKTVDNIKFESIGIKGLKLGAEAQFHNGNPLKCKVVDVDMNVLVDEKLIGVLGEKSDVVIQKKSDFTIPLGVLIKPEGTILENFKTLYKILTDRPTMLYLVGNIKVKMMGLKFDVPVKYRQVLKRSDFK